MVNPCAGPGIGTTRRNVRLQSWSSCKCKVVRTLTSKSRYGSSLLGAVRLPFLTWCFAISIPYRPATISASSTPPSNSITGSPSCSCSCGGLLSAGFDDADYRWLRWLKNYVFPLIRFSRARGAQISISRHAQTAPNNSQNPTTMVSTRRGCCRPRC